MSAGRAALIKEYQRVRRNYIRYIKRHQDQLRGYSPIGIPSGLRQRSSKRIEGSIRRVESEYARVRGIVRDRAQARYRLDSEALDRLQELINIAMYLPAVGVSDYYGDSRYFDNTGQLYPSIRNLVVDRGHVADRRVRGECTGTIRIGGYEISRKRIVIENLEAGFQSIYADMESYLYGYQSWLDDAESSGLLAGILKILSDTNVIILSDLERKIVDEITSTEESWGGEMYG